MQSNNIARCLREVLRLIPADFTDSGLKTMATAQLIEQQRQSTFAPHPMAAGGKKPKYLIVGLGNHDRPLTRHSVGMQVVDKLAGYLHAPWVKDQKNCVGFVAQTSISDNLDVVLLKPKMPMNVNGTSVAKTAQLFDIEPQHIYLVHDDIDKSLGKVAVKELGSANGHNGVRSCMNSLRSDLMPRLKIGIDRPPSKDEVSDYVLSEFSSSEQQIVNRAVDTCLVTIADHMARRTGVELRKVLNLPQAESKTRPESKREM
ncbi:probable peptidyl-tRNA hydrolase [Liolophura sinensis]|uniref:probable peptidyl-tRNA hydrolase n=1 Tax=Liolophura sinensis TaxID=3198878 RepID=UPI00315949C8